MARWEKSPRFRTNLELNWVRRRHEISRSVSSMVARRAASHTIAKSGVAQNCEPNEYVRDRRDANFASPQMTRRPIAGYRPVSYQRDHQYSFVDVLKDIIEHQGPFTARKGFAVARAIFLFKVRRMMVQEKIPG